MNRPASIARAFSAHGGGGGEYRSIYLYVYTNGPACRAPAGRLRWPWRWWSRVYLSINLSIYLSKYLDMNRPAGRARAERSRWPWRWWWRLYIYMYVYV